MYELLYMSIAVKEMTDGELAELLEESRRHNSEVGITGMLLYRNREFMQILEGPRHEVVDLYQGIRADERHTSVVTIHEGPIHDRAFSSWSMAYKKLDQGDLDALLEGQESFSLETSPINLIKDNPNMGKELFLRVRQSLYKGQ